MQHSLHSALHQVAFLALSKDETAYETAEHYQHLYPNFGAQLSARYGLHVLDPRHDYRVVSRGRS